jgi:hypothetical protein
MPRAPDVGSETAKKLTTKYEKIFFKFCCPANSA